LLTCNTKKLLIIPIFIST